MQQVSLILEKAADSKPGIYRLKASGPSVDRDGEVVEIDTVQVGRRMPIFLDHQRTNEKMVATAKPEVVGQELFVDVKFLDNFYAKQLQSMLDDKDHREAVGMSVGIRGAKRKTVDGVPHWTGGELMEVSFTSTPAYPDTGLVKSADLEKGVKGSHEDTTERLRKAIRDLEATYVYVRATYEKTVVYEYYDYEKGDTLIVSREWSMSGDNISLGDPVKGSLVTTFVPDAPEAAKEPKKNADDDPVTEPPSAATKTESSFAVDRARAALALARAS